MRSTARPGIGSTRINQTDIDRLADWLIRRGLEGLSEAELLRLFCEKCGAAGLPVDRALMLIDTLHPIHEGHVFRWRNDGAEEEPIREYGPVSYTHLTLPTILRV